MKKLLYGFLGLVIIFSGNTFAEKAWVSVTDNIAGNASNVRVSGLYSSEEISIKLVRPDKSNIKLKSFADEFGVSNFQVSPINISKSGKYELIISRDLQEYPTVKTFFIYPGEVSAYKSEIIIENPAISADGLEVSRLIIKAKDSYGNIVKNAPVKIFSSRNNDLIVYGKKTDSKGEVNGKISSKTAGVSTISVLLNETILYEKPEIVFFIDNDEIEDAGAGWNIGKFLKTQLFDDPQENTNIAYFSIENMASEASVGENLTVKVVAKDEEGGTVVNYTGTVRFSSSDDRANLPSDYTFTSSDQGEHDFYLSTTFGTGGEQSLAAHDLDDFRISGEQSINIALDSGPVQISDDPKLTIDIPTSGSSFNTARVTISGTAQQCNIVKLVDGQITLIDNLTVDESNKYIYQTPSLADGTHIFQAICAEDEELVSNKVSITIDRTPPQVIAVETIPDGPFCGNENIVVNIDGEDLESVSCVFNEQIFNLSKNNAGKFETQLTIPNRKGEFPMECTVSDLLGNSVTESNASVISVTPKACDPKEESVNNNEEVKNEEPENVSPTAVTNLSAKSGEIEKVTLFWSPSNDDKGISSYRVNFEECGPNPLLRENMTPDDRTQWYVDNLNSCTDYCFQVVGVDSEGLESPASNVAVGTPFCPEELHTSPPKTPKSGNASNIAIAISIIAGIFMIILSRRKEA